MICKKDTGFQYLVFFCVMNLFFVSLSFAESNISIKGDSLKGKPVTSAQASKPIISNEQLTQCLEKIKLANQTAYELEEQSDNLERLKNYLEGLKQKLESARTHLDWHSQDSVNEYNEMKKRLTELSQNYSSEAENYNYLVEQHKADNEALKIECDDKRYFENKTTPVFPQ